MEKLEQVKIKDLYARLGGLGIDADVSQNGDFTLEGKVVEVKLKELSITKFIEIMLEGKPEGVDAFVVGEPYKNDVAQGHYGQGSTTEKYYPVLYLKLKEGRKND